MKKVNVLLSSYNGEKYIKKQIDSILGQTYGDITLYVRDDGSSDKTLDILKKYEANGDIILIAGENVGFIRSFFELVRSCARADYYAFADQDDEWFPDKIQMAVEKLERCADDIPVLYFSNYNIVNEKLEFMSVAFPEDENKHPSFRNAIVDCMPLGFNSVFNDTARQMMVNNTPLHSCGHDWWTYMICQGMGKVIYDSRPTVNYRRTGNNVSAGGMSFIKFQIWRIKKFFIGGYFKNVRMMLAEYWYFYKDKLDAGDRKLLSYFVRKRYNVIAALKKTFYPHMFRQSMSDEIMLRFLFLIGRL